MKNNTILKLSIFCVWAVLISAYLFLNAANAEITQPYEPGNKLTTMVTAEITKDPSTQIYTYTYTVTNNSGSQQELETFALAVAPGIEVIESTAPKGWGFFVESDKTLISWAAIDSDPATANVEYTNLADLDVPSPYTIKPGETLSGFSVKTMTAPGAGAYYARGFTHIPSATSEADFEQLAQNRPDHFTEDSFSGETTGPVIASYLGGRRPAVDGFLGFLNLQKRENVFKSPALIVLKFSMSGETVYRDTFKAKLNGVDVTSMFHNTTMYGGDLSANFTMDSSPLKPGRNVIETSVDGQVPGTARDATDTDRVTFYVE